MYNYSLQDVTGANAPTAVSGGQRQSFADNFMAMFQQIMQIQQQRAAIDAAQEERDYKKKFHQHEIRSLDLEDKRKQLEARIKAAGLDYGTSDPPTVDLTGFEDLGFPSMMYKAPSLKERLARQTQEGAVATQLAGDKTAAENAVNLPPNIAALFNKESGGNDFQAGKYDKSLLEPLIKLLMDKVEVPQMPGAAPGVGPSGVPTGKYDKEALTLFSNQFDKSTVPASTKFTQAGTDRNSALQRQNNLDVANVYATTPHQGGRYGTGVGGDDTAIQEWARRISVGQAKISEAPMGLRNLIMKQLGADDNVIMTPKLQEKFAQFIPAKAALDELEKAVTDYSNASITNSPVETAVLGLKLQSKVGAFSRLVGRATGEKGVFTDADKADFMKYISPMGVLGATIKPDMALSAIADARGLMAKIEANSLNLATTPKPQASGGRPSPTPAATPKPAAGGVPARPGFIPATAEAEYNTDTGQWRYRLTPTSPWVVK